MFIGALRIWNCGVSKNSEIIGSNSAGGILGKHTNYGTNYVYNSYVLGELSGDKYIGGIAGNAVSRKAVAGVKVKIENSYFAGTIEGGTKVGGIIGESSYEEDINIEQQSFKNCYYINNIEKGISNVETGGITALSEKDMKEKDTLVTYLRSYTNAEQELSAWDKPSNEYPIHTY